MYQSIEAELENGRVKSPELQKLPAVAHVLITWIQSSVMKSRPKPVFGCAKGQVFLSDDFDEPLDDFSEYMQ